jgi:Fic family protein
MNNCLGLLEKFLHDEPVRTPPLIKAALAHVQFETIHPFLDGNGRLGRLLITFILCNENAMREPLLYLSFYFKQHREEYYSLLQNVRETGDWEAWLRFFLNGIAETSRAAVMTMRASLELFERDRTRLSEIRSTSSALRVHEVMQRRPIVGIGEVAEWSSLSAPTVSAVFQQMEDLGMVREITGNQRNRLYAYTAFINILSDGID